VFRGVLVQILGLRAALPALLVYAREGVGIDRLLLAKWVSLQGRRCSDLSP